jgi:hypothetical protein
MSEHALSAGGPIGRLSTAKLRSPVTVEQASALPCVPLQRFVLLRVSQAGKVGDMRGLQKRGWSIERLLEGRKDPPQGRLHHEAGSYAPTSCRKRVRLRTHPRHGGDPGPVPLTRRVNTPPQRCSRRQSAREPGAMDSPTASRYPRQRRRGLGARDPRSL